MKSYTNLEQSKKLAKILPLESADMWWAWYSSPLSNGHYGDFPMFCKPVCNPDESVPCWSLSALISVLPSRLFDSTPKRKELYLLPDSDKSYCFYRQFAVKTKGKIYLLTEGECLVDACYKMVLKLHELNLL